MCQVWSQSRKRSDFQRFIIARRQFAVLCSDSSFISTRDSSVITGTTDAHMVCLQNMSQLYLSEMVKIADDPAFYMHYGKLKKDIPNH